MLQRFNENHWGGGVTLKGTKVSNLYKYFK